MFNIEKEVPTTTSKLETEVQSLHPEKDFVRIQELEKIIESDDLQVEHFLKSKKRKAFSFKVVRRYRQRVRAREMIDFLEIPSDSEDDS